MSSAQSQKSQGAIYHFSFAGRENDERLRESRTPHKSRMLFVRACTMSRRDKVANGECSAAMRQCLARGPISLDGAVGPHSTR